MKMKRNKHDNRSQISIAIHNFGLITGEAIEDEVLDKIFSEFCIGK